MVAWLADGPELVTGFRQPGTLNYYIARGLEIGVVVMSLCMIVYLIRDCRRAGRVLTFEVMYCMACATITWGDLGGLNFFQPIFVASSNFFVSVNNPCGHMPFVVNPDCGRTPDPVLFFFLFEVFGCLLLAIWVSRLVAWIRARRPGWSWSMAGVFRLVMTIGFVMSLSEILMVAFGIWGYAGPQWLSFSPGNGGQYNVVILAETGLFSGMMLALYVVRDDKGQRIVERGLDRHSPRRRNAVTLMALYTCVQFATWVPGSLPVAALSFFQDGWPKMPAYFVNGVCDAPGFQGTRYGPCPGSPGYRMPGRHSLPGRSP